MEEIKNCPLCAVSGKQSIMRIAPKAIGRDFDMFCCVTCFILMSADEIEARWLELAGHYKRSLSLMAELNRKRGL